MTAEDLLDLAAAALAMQRVRVYDTSGRRVMAEGVIVGYYTEPVMVIRADDGDEVTVPCRLPREAVTERVLRGVR